MDIRRRACSLVIGRSREERIMRCESHRWLEREISNGSIFKNSNRKFLRSDALQKQKRQKKGQNFIKKKHLQVKTCHLLKQSIVFVNFRNGKFHLCLSLIPTDDRYRKKNVNIQEKAKSKERGGQDQQT